jgi:PRTRC genetic system protein E
MFKDLHQLALQTPLTLMVSAEGDLLTLTILPRQDAAKSASHGIDRSALAQPLQLTGTPEELSVEFVTLLGRYCTERASLTEQLQATEAVLKAAKEAAATKAATTVRGGKAKPASVTSKPHTQEVEFDDHGEGDDEASPASTTAPDGPAAKPEPTQATDNLSLF